MYDRAWIHTGFSKSQDCPCLVDDQTWDRLHRELGTSRHVTFAAKVCRRHDLGQATPHCFSFLFLFLLLFLSPQSMKRRYFTLMDTMEVLYYEFSKEVRYADEYRCTDKEGNFIEGMGAPLGVIDLHTAYHVEVVPHTSDPHSHYAFSVCDLFPRLHWTI